MDTTGWIILAVVVLGALLLGALVITSMKKKSRHDDHLRAQQLREQADARTGDLSRDQDEVRKAQAQAEEARKAAEAADARAAEAQTSLAQQEAQHEDRLRAADRLDPEVDHQADDYTPTPAGSHRGESTEGGEQADVPPHSDPSHREHTDTEATDTDHTDRGDGRTTT